MHNPEPMRLLFVVNPISGGKQKTDWESAIREYFKDKRQSIAFYLLTGEDDKRSLQHHIERFNPARVVAVGGDGTVKMVADLLKETTMVMGILPAGSANGMAAELCIPDDTTAALDIVANGREQKIDLLRINEEQVCIHLADVGLNAMLVKYFEKSEKRGMWGYGKAVARVLWEKRKLRVSIQTEKELIKRKAYMVVLANARKYGTGANINPDGNISDGHFEVVILRKINVFEIMKAVFTDHSFVSHRIEVIPATSAAVRIHRKSYFQVDGEFQGEVSSVDARILPGILNVMVPL